MDVHSLVLSSLLGRFHVLLVTGLEYCEYWVEYEPETHSMHSRTWWHAPRHFHWQERRTLRLGRAPCLGPHAIQFDPAKNPSPQACASQCA